MLPTAPQSKVCCVIQVCLSLLNPVITTWHQKWLMGKNLKEFEIQTEKEVGNRKWNNTVMWKDKSFLHSYSLGKMTVSH